MLHGLFKNRIPVCCCIFAMLNGIACFTSPGFARQDDQRSTRKIPVEPGTRIAPNLLRLAPISAPQTNGVDTDSLPVLRPGGNLRQKVKIVADPDSGMLTLVGLKEDIEIVRQVILQLDRQLQTNSDLTTAKVRLEFQLSETVAAILQNSSPQTATGSPSLKITALHFPEAILLSGRAAAVAEAKRIIKQVDSHPDFETSK